MLTTVLCGNLESDVLLIAQAFALLEKRVYNIIRN